MNYYIVSFDRSPTNRYDSFHTDFVSHSGIRRWSHHIKSTYLVGTEMTARELSRHFRSTALKHALPTRHIVLRIDPRNRSGWLPVKAWEWLNKQAKDQD